MSTIPLHHHPGEPWGLERLAAKRFPKLVIAGLDPATDDGAKRVLPYRSVAVTSVVARAIMGHRVKPGDDEIGAGLTVHRDFRETSGDAIPFAPRSRAIARVAASQP
ncbi:MAG: hypothetical protein ACWA6X_15070 [Bauldia sp.]